MSKRYDYSVNVTVLELKRMLEFAKTNSTNVIGLHFTSGLVLDAVCVSLGLDGWGDVKSHVDVTDWDSA